MDPRMPLCESPGMQSISALEGQVALITGGGSGVGAAIALALADVKVEVRLIGRTSQRLREVAERVRRLGGRADYCVADLGDKGELRALTDRLVRDLPGLDILVQSAAIHVAG